MCSSVNLTLNQACTCASIATSIMKSLKGHRLVPPVLFPQIERGLLYKDIAEITHKSIESDAIVLLSLKGIITVKQKMR